MNCDRVNEQLSGYLDGELPAGVAEQLAAHFDGCPACRASAERLRAVDASVVASADRQAGQFDADALSHRLAARVARPTQRRPWVGWAVAAGLLLATGVAVAMMLPWQGVGPEPKQAGTGAEADPETQPPGGRPVVAGVLPQSPDTGLAELATATQIEPGRAHQPISQPPTFRADHRSSAVAAAPGLIGPPGLLATPSANPPTPGEPIRLQTGGVAMVALAGVGPYAPDRSPAMDELLRQVEVVLTRAATLPPRRSPQWQKLADRVRSDQLIARCRDARDALPAGSELGKLLASAEAILIRTEQAGTWSQQAAAVREAIKSSKILERCRELRT